MFDYDIDKLDLLWDQLETYKPLMETPGKTIFATDMVKNESTIKKNAKKRNILGIFYPSVNHKVDISRFKSDFLNFGGIEPMAMAEGSELRFEYKFMSLLGTVVLGCVFLF